MMVLRDSQSGDGGPAAARRLRDNFMAAIPRRPGEPVSGFWATRSEISTVPLLTALVEQGHAVGLPVMQGRGKPLRFRRWTPGAALVPGPFSIPVPEDSAESVVPSLVIVPLLAFDSAGYRLGYGGGYYDRTLAELRGAGSVLAVGIAFAAQEVAAVPRESFDQPLDWIVTDDGARAFSGSAASTGQAG